MKQEVKDRMFHEVAEEVAKILCQKNHDYGDSFHNQYVKFGDISTAIRLGDKIQRLETLSVGVDPKIEESIEDVYKDIAGYAILSLVSKKRAEMGDK